jgi:hypothetical protein
LVGEAPGPEREAVFDDVPKSVDTAERSLRHVLGDDAAAGLGIDVGREDALTRAPSASSAVAVVWLQDCRPV